MTEKNRWSDERYGDRYRQDEYRSDLRAEPHGRSEGRDRYRDQNYGGGQRFGQTYGVDREHEDRSFGAESGYDPYGAAYGGYGEDVYRDQRYRADLRDNRRYDNRQASGAMLHQGYRAPFGGQRGDAQGYGDAAGAGGRSGEADDHGRYPASSQRANFASGDSSGQNGRGWWNQTRDEVSSWFGDDQATQRRHMDEARDGQHRGRGPKGYTRSDDRIREDVNDRLTDDHQLDASDIEVKVANGEVTLAGHIANRQDKRRAEDIADRIAGVKHVQNNLRVKEQDSGPAASAQASASQAAGMAGQPVSKSN